MAHQTITALYDDYDAASTAVFRIVQEALTNIARHARAQNVLLNLYRTNGELLVTIQDDGRGIRRHRWSTRRRTSGVGRA